MENKIAFGPVPSRRLGRSMGINNIPPKICTYSCVYCQLGRTLDIQVESREFYRPERVAENVEAKAGKAEDAGENIDYLTFVPDGEPTLDANLGREIEMLKQMGVKIAVITNSSLIWRDDVRNELRGADWVSLKIDSVTEKIWRRVNRPHGRLDLDKIMDGIEDFSRDFEGKLATETMLVKGFNDSEDEIRKIASFISGLNISKSYVSIPTRPPGEKWVKPASEHAINAAYQIFSDAGIDAEYLIVYEGNEFALTGDAEEDLLGIMSVHPMREDAVNEFLEKAGASWEVIENMLAGKNIIELDYMGNRFYMRKLSGKYW